MRLIIDTDPGMGSRGADPEDGLAILLALGSPEVHAAAAAPLHRDRIPQNAGLRMREGLERDGPTVPLPDEDGDAGEFNIWMDPEAADIVFRSGAPITMVGLDVCHRRQFDLSDVAALRGTGDLAELVSVGVGLERFDRLFRERVLTPLESRPRQPD